MARLKMIEVRFEYLNGKVADMVKGGNNYRSAKRNLRLSKYRNAVLERQIAFNKEVMMESFVDFEVLVSQEEVQLVEEFRIVEINKYLSVDSEGARSYVEKMQTKEFSSLYADFVYEAIEREFARIRGLKKC